MDLYTYISAKLYHRQVQYQRLTRKHRNRLSCDVTRIWVCLTQIQEPTGSVRVRSIAGNDKYGVALLIFLIRFTPNLFAALSLSSSRMVRTVTAN